MRKKMERLPQRLRGQKETPDSKVRRCLLLMAIRSDRRSHAKHATFSGWSDNLAHYVPQR